MTQDRRITDKLPGQPLDWSETDYTLSNNRILELVKTAPTGLAFARAIEADVRELVEAERRATASAAAPAAGQAGLASDWPTYADLLAEDLEKIAESWTGCMYDAPGAMLDIGADLRSQFAKLKLAAPVAVTLPPQLTDKMAEALEDAVRGEMSVEWDPDLGSNVSFGDWDKVYAALRAAAPVAAAPASFFDALETFKQSDQGVTASQRFADAVIGAPVAADTEQATKLPEGWRERLQEMREASYTISQYPETAQVIFDSVIDALEELDAPVDEPSCDHVWPEADGQVDINGYCEKCGLSFQRYIHGDNLNENLATPADAGAGEELTEAAENLRALAKSGRELRQEGGAYNLLPHDIAELERVADLLARMPTPGAQVKCAACHGSGWVTRDADIGTDQECSVCEGSGNVEEGQSPAPVTAEPVAWAFPDGLARLARVRDGYADSPLLVVHAKDAGGYNVPLYTAPAPADRDAIRDQALEDAAKACDVIYGGWCGVSEDGPSAAQECSISIRALKSMERAADAKGGE